MAVDPFSVNNCKIKSRMTPLLYLIETNATPTFSYANKSTDFFLNFVDSRGNGSRKHSYYADNTFI